MGVRIKASDKMVEVQNIPHSSSSILGKYWNGERHEYRIKITDYEVNEAFQQEMLKLFEQSDMTDYGRVRWVLRMDKVDKPWVYDVILFQVPDVEIFR